MRKIVVGMFIMLWLAGSAWATPIYTGSISSGDGLYGTTPWDSARLDWTIDYNEIYPSLWTYDYKFTVPSKGISHVIIEVSDTFHDEEYIDPAPDPIDDSYLDNIYTGTTENWELGTFGDQQGNSNPGILDDVYGIKWDSQMSGSTNYIWNWRIVTDRKPMWGDFYAKDGKDGGNDVYAYNTNFGTDAGTLTEIADDNAGGWVLVPDTISGGGGGGGGEVPEPSTIFLLGGGLLMLATGWRRKKKK